MVGAVVLGSQRHQAEVGLHEPRRHDEIRGYERPFSHGHERTRLGDLFDLVALDEWRRRQLKYS